MKLLLNAMTTQIQTQLAYLSWVGVLDSEFLPPEEPQTPFVGLRDGGLVAESTPNKMDFEDLTVVVIAYQSVLASAPGASVLGEASLGDAGIGLLDLSAALKTALNDNFLSLNFFLAHRFRVDRSETLESDAGRFLQFQRNYFRYRRYV